MVRTRAQPNSEGWLCDVIVVTQGGESRHTVAVRKLDLERWGDGGSDAAAAEDLVSRSFAFLLEREPPGSILRSFDLAVIQRYFPEFDRAIRR